MGFHIYNQGTTTHENGDVDIEVELRHIIGNKTKSIYFFYFKICRSRDRMPHEYRVIQTDQTRKLDKVNRRISVCEKTTGMKSLLWSDSEYHYYPIYPTKDYQIQFKGHTIVNISKKYGFDVHIASSTYSDEDDEEED